MVKKSPLTLVPSRAHATPEPPRPLGEAGRSLWVRVSTPYAIDDVGGREILVSGVRCRRHGGRAFCDHRR